MTHDAQHIMSRHTAAPGALRSLLLLDALWFGLIPTVSALYQLPERITQLQQFTYMGPFAGIMYTNLQLAVLEQTFFGTVGIAVLIATWSTSYGSHRARRRLLLLLAVAGLRPTGAWVLSMFNSAPYGAMLSMSLLLVNVWYLRHQHTRTFFDQPNAALGESQLHERLMQRAKELLSAEEYAAWLQFVVSGVDTTDDPLTLQACRKFDSDPQVQALAASDMHLTA